MKYDKIMSSGLSVKYLLLFFDFNENLNFLHRFSKNTYTSNFMKIISVGAELFHEDTRTDGRTDMTKLIVAFRKFENAP